MNKKFRIKAIVICDECGNCYTIPAAQYSYDTIEYNPPSCHSKEMTVKVGVFECKN